MTERSTPAPGETTPGETRPEDAGSDQASAGEASAREAAAGEAGSDQAGAGEASAREASPASEARAVTTLTELKALADPLRLAILHTLSGGATRELRVLSVKELAAELGEPKTKLYRHIKLLEAAGLIRVAATRLVSGIVEQRYQACQVDLFVGPWAMGEPGAAEAANAAVSHTLDWYRRHYLDYLASLPPSLPPGPPPEDRSYLTYKASTVSPARARIIQDKLREAAAEFDGPPQPGDDAEDAVQIEALISYMTAE